MTSCFKLPQKATSHSCFCKKGRDAGPAPSEEPLHRTCRSLEKSSRELPSRPFRRRSGPGSGRKLVPQCRLPDLAERGAGVRHEKGDRDPPPPLVGPSNHVDLGDAAVLFDQALDLCREDLEAG